MKEYEIEIHLNSQVLQEAKLVRYAKCDKKRKKILLRLLHLRAKKHFSEMVSPHPVMERADSSELGGLLCQKELLL